MTTRTLPPTHRIAATVLAANAGVTAIMTRVYGSNTRPRNPTIPYVYVERFAGLPTEWGDDHAQLQINCYARTDDEGFSLARACYKALLEAGQVQAEGVLTGVELTLGLRPLPDPIYKPPKGTRWIFGVTAHAHS